MKNKILITLLSLIYVIIMNSCTQKSRNYIIVSDVYLTDNNNKLSSKYRITMFDEAGSLSWNRVLYTDSLFMPGDTIWYSHKKPKLY